MQTDRVGLAAVAPCWATCSWPAWWRSAAGQLAFRLRAQGLLVGAGLVAAGDVRPSWQQRGQAPAGHAGLPRVPCLVSPLNFFFTKRRFSQKTNVCMEY